MALFFSLTVERPTTEVCSFRCPSVQATIAAGRPVVENPSVSSQENKKEQNSFFYDPELRK